MILLYVLNLPSLDSEIPKAPITMWLRARRPAMERVIGDVGTHRPGIRGKISQDFGGFNHEQMVFFDGIPTI